MIKTIDHDGVVSLVAERTNWMHRQSDRKIFFPVSGHCGIKRDFFIQCEHILSASSIAEEGKTDKQPA